MALRFQAFLGALAVPLAWLAVPHPASAFDFEEVAPGLWVHQGRHELPTARNRGDLANLVAVIGDGAVAVIDTGGSYEVGAGLRDAIRAETDLPIRYVINTHFHPDHVLGNAAFLEDDPAFVGHAKLERALADRGPHYLARMGELMGAAAIDGSEIVLPTLAVADRLTLDLGGRVLQLQAWPTAHTSADLTVFDPATGTLIAGDLLFMEHVPVVDGSLLGWLDWSRAQDGTENGIEWVVPGHGPKIAAWPDAKMAQDAYLAYLRDRLRQSILSGESLREASETIEPESGAAWLLTEEFHPRNVVTGFTELEWE